MAENLAEKLKKLTLAVDQATLEQAEKDVATQRIKLAEEHKRIRAEIDRRKAEAEARAKFEALSAGEKAVLAQMIQAEGVQSAEKFGNPGS